MKRLIRSSKFEYQHICNDCEHAEFSGYDSDNDRKYLCYGKDSPYLGKFRKETDTCKAFEVSKDLLLFNS